MKQEIYVSSNKHNIEPKKDYSKECEEKCQTEQVPYCCHPYDCKWCVDLTPEVPFSKQYPYGLGETNITCIRRCKEYIVEI